MLRKYMVERNLGGVAYLSTTGFNHLAKRENDATLELGHDHIQWIQTLVSDDRIYCVYLAEDEEFIWEHARISELPIDRVSEITKTLDPTTHGPGERPYVPGADEIYDSIL